MVDMLGKTMTRTHQKNSSFGTQILPNGEGTLFRLWAPSANQVEVLIDSQAYPMQGDANGWYACQLKDAAPGTLYQFRIDGDLQVPDPASRFQPQDTHGPSQVIDPSRFAWQDSDWRGRPWEETVLYEVHVGTFTPEGTYAGVKKKLDYLVALGVTAIELMPVADFSGLRNWGYDGVLPYAPDSSYGTPDALKDLIQTAHQKGLMVFLDVVYNHFGVDGNYLYSYANPFFTERFHTPWGAAIQFDGPQPIRDFFIENALYWLNEYHFDGLRLDAVHAIHDPSPKHFLREFAARVRAGVDSNRHIHLVLENDDNTAHFLEKADGQEQFDAQWNDDFHHAAHVIATGESFGYYSDYATHGNETGATAAIYYLSRCLEKGFAYQGEPSPYRKGEPRGETSVHLPLSSFVNFLQNHDQIGNRAFGERLVNLAKPESVRALTEILLLAPTVPLLFMGDEWGASQPFLFFCNFNEELGKLVTEGRRREFASMPEFSDPKTRERIPDPSAVETFEASRLNWAELEQPEHQNWLSLYKKLLSIRQQEVVHRMSLIIDQGERQRNCKLFEKTGLWLEWPLKDGTTLILLANLGNMPLTLPVTLFDNSPVDRIQTLYQSEHTVDPTQSIAKLIQVPGWSVFWLTKH